MSLCNLPCTIVVPYGNLQAGTVRDEITAVTIPKPSKTTGLGKTTMDVMGICCPNEVPLIKKLLEPISGVEEVSVNATSKTVTVLHDQYLVPAVQLGSNSCLSTSKHVIRSTHYLAS